jgi:hypothetical protein
MVGKFNPLHIPNCALWLEADRGITLDGSNNVSAWADQSGNITLTQSSESTRLSYSGNICNGRAAVVNTGAVKRVEYGGYNKVGSQHKITFFYVLQTNTPETYQYIVAYASVNYYLRLVTNGGALFVVGPGSDYANFNSGIGTSPVIITIIYDGTGQTNADRLKMYLNGGQKSLAFTGTIPATTPACDTILLGSRYSGVGLNGYLPIHLIYQDALSTQHRERLERFYGSKYGITVA